MYKKIISAFFVIPILLLVTVLRVNAQASNVKTCGETWNTSSETAGCFCTDSAGNKALSSGSQSNFVTTIKCCGWIDAKSNRCSTSYIPPQTNSTNNSEVGCGEKWNQSQTQKACNCVDSENNPVPPTGNSFLPPISNTLSCCGWTKAGSAQCYNNEFFIDSFMGVDSQVLSDLNPLNIVGSTQAANLQTPAGILNRVISFLFPIAGFILFMMLVFGGLEMMLGAATKKNYDSGKQRATSAVIGFILLFVSYWLAKLIELVFGIKIL